MAQILRVFGRWLFDRRREERGKLLREKRALQEDRDGLCRELWMARKSLEEWKLEAARDYQHLAGVAEMLRSRLEHAESALQAERERGRLTISRGGLSSPALMKPEPRDESLAVHIQSEMVPSGGIARGEITINQGLSNP